MIVYYKLSLLLLKGGMKKEAFRKRVGISSPTMAKLGKNEPVSLAIIDKICEALSCQPNDIMEYIPESNEFYEKNGGNYEI